MLFMPTKKEYQTLIYLLNKVAEVDGDIGYEERLFSQQVAGNLNIDYLEAINEGHEFSIPSAENERIVFYFHLLQLIELDKKITVKEIEILKKIGFKFALNPLLINSLIELYLNHLSKPIPQDQIAETLKRYLN